MKRDKSGDAVFINTDVSPTPNDGARGTQVSLQAARGPRAVC